MRNNICNDIFTIIEDEPSSSFFEKIRMSLNNILLTHLAYEEMKIHKHILKLFLQ
jgi:hypothetical protein